MDLGATYPGALRLVVLPIIAPAMVAAALAALTVSFDGFALELFLVGKEPTFPVYLFGQLRIHDHAADDDRHGCTLDDGDLGVVAVRRTHPTHR